MLKVGLQVLQVHHLLLLLLLLLLLTGHARSCRSDGGGGLGLLRKSATNREVDRWKHDRLCQTGRGGGVDHEGGT